MTPWKPPSKQTTSVLPVNFRTSFRAASTAFAPPGPGNCVRVGEAAGAEDQLVERGPEVPLRGGEHVERLDDPVGGEIVEQGPLLHRIVVPVVPRPDTRREVEVGAPGLVIDPAAGGAVEGHGPPGGNSSSPWTRAPRTRPGPGSGRSTRRWSSADIRPPPAGARSPDSLARADRPRCGTPSSRRSPPRRSNGPPGPRRS